MCVGICFISLEKIRFSITRLKLTWKWLPKRRVSAWKDKILDYEIEMVYATSGSTPNTLLKR